jgi:hypothetical protein
VRGQWKRAAHEITNERARYLVKQYRNNSESVNALFAKYAHDVRSGEAAGVAMEDWLCSRRDKLNQTRQALKDWTREKRKTSIRSKQV